MSKKPQIKQNPKAAKIQIVDQQTQPFLRTLQKRVRNINKKLTQIAELSAKKEDLKPEQIQKINRKNQYIEQKNRLQQMSNYYRQTLVQNAEYYRNLQLKELDNVAASIAVFNTGRFKEHDKLAEFHNFFFGSINPNITLNERIAQVSSTLRKVHLDEKLKKAFAAFIAQNGDKKVQEEAEEAVNNQQVHLVESLIADEPVKKEEPAVVTAKVQQQRSPVKQTVVVQTKPVQTATEQVPATQNKEQKPVQEKKVQGAEQEKRPRGENRTRYNNRNRDANRQYRDRNNNVNGQRKYKPKYEPKEGQQHQQRQSPSDDDQQQQEARNFRRDQIKKLEDDGFTVIGKPKPKAKHGQKQWHEHTHGRKQHHHHNPNI